MKGVGISVRGASLCASIGATLPNESEVESRSHVTTPPAMSQTAAARRYSFAKMQQKLKNTERSETLFLGDKRT